MNAQAWVAVVVAAVALLIQYGASRAMLAMHAKKLDGMDTELQRHWKTLVAHEGRLKEHERRINRLDERTT